MKRSNRKREPPKRLRNEQVVTKTPRRPRTKARGLPGFEVQTRNINNVNLRPARKLNANAAQARVLTVLDSIAEGKNEKI